MKCENCGNELIDKGTRLVCRHCGMWGRSDLQ